MFRSSFDGGIPICNNDVTQWNKKITTEFAYSNSNKNNDERFQTMETAETTNQKEFFGKGELPSWFHRVIASS